MKEGETYLSGLTTIFGDEKSILIFKNEKKKENQPDYNIFVDVLDISGKKKLIKIGSLWKRVKKENTKQVSDDF